MPEILIISSSIRNGRKSNRLALFFSNYLKQHQLAGVSIADLSEMDFPLFKERLKFLESPGTILLDFAAAFKKADGILIVTPEYNGGYPASLKNVIDVFNDEWVHKPVAVCTVSAGAFGGSQVITSLQFSLWKMKALVCNAVFPVPAVEKAFDESGIPADKENTEKRAAAFIEEFLWTIERR